MKRFVCCAALLSLTLLSSAAAESTLTDDPAVDSEAGQGFLSIKDLERAFATGGLSDRELIESMGDASPLTPDQIRAVRRHIDQIRRATSEPPKPPPRAVVSSRTVSFEPGAELEQLRLYNGVVSSIVFQDVTGAPWPVRHVATGNADWVIEHIEGSNILTISPRVEYSYSNISILLDGAPAPIVMLLEAGRHAQADHRLDLVVQGRGPHAISLSMDVGRSPAAIPAHMISFQDGVPPEKSQRLKTSGADGVSAWRMDDRMVLRTRMTLASPAATRAIRSADGTYVYEVEPTPVVFLLAGGRTVRLNIEL